MAGSSVRAKDAPAAQLRAYIERFDGTHQRLIRAVRAAIRKRLPTANELVYDYRTSIVIGYSPSDLGIQSILAIAARVDRVELYFNQGKLLPDPTKLLKGSAKQVRFIAVEAARQLAHPDVEALIAAAVAHAPVPLPPTGRGKLVMKAGRAKKVARRKRAM